MGFQPLAEKEAERQTLRAFAKRYGSEIIKLQPDEDDGGTDGIIVFQGVRLSVEVRRKGYKNHWGKTTKFKHGWNAECLLEGIYLLGGYKW